MQTWITVELICAASGGLLGAWLSMVSNKKKETFIEGVLLTLIGIVFGAGGGTKWGADDPVWCCLIGIVSGSCGGLVIEAVQKHIPEAIRNVINGWVERLGGKTEEESNANEE